MKPTHACGIVEDGRGFIGARTVAREGAVALALKMLTVGAVMAPSVPTDHPKGPAIPVVWELDGENGRGGSRAPRPASPTRRSSTINR